MVFRRFTKWPGWGWTSPFEELEHLRRQMDRLTEGLTSTLSREPMAGVFPLINLSEDDDSLYARAELPGVKADDLNISVTGNTLSVSGERKIDPESENAKYHRREREEGKFNRIINLPSQVDTGKVEARSDDGILTVILPKAESAKPKQILVRAL